jgi:hypothetical protein
LVRQSGAKSVRLLGSRASRPCLLHRTRSTRCQHPVPRHQRVAEAARLLCCTRSDGPILGSLGRCGKPQDRPSGNELVTRPYAKHPSVSVASEACLLRFPSCRSDSGRRRPPQRSSSGSFRRAKRARLVNNPQEVADWGGRKGVPVKPLRFVDSFSPTTF